MSIPIQILLVEDNSGDIKLTRMAFQNLKIRNDIQVVKDGVEALAYLRCQGVYADAPRPDLILLDLNLPRKDGREVLIEIKNDEDLKPIPVIILTTSADDKDVLDTYTHYANSYITKPIDLEGFITIVRTIEDFWLSIVKLPKRQ